MNPQKNAEFGQALPKIGRAVLVTGGFGLVLCLSGVGLIVISTGLVLGVVLSASRTLASFSGFLLIALSEILVFSLAAGCLFLGFGLFLKGVADALTGLGRAPHIHKADGCLETVGFDLARWAQRLMNGTTAALKVVLGGRKRQLLMLLLAGILPPLLAFWSRSIIQPRGVAIIKRAILVSIYFFEYAGIALALALSGGIFIRRTENHAKTRTANRSLTAAIVELN